MKKTITTLLLSLPLISLCQESEKKKATAEDTKEFYTFSIPAVLNGSNLDPTPISNVNFNLTDSKISLKLGFPYLFRQPAGTDFTEKFNWTGFVQGNVKATNGTSTLFKDKSPSVDYGLSAGISRKLSHSYWVRKEGETITTDRVSEALNWLNLIGTIEKNNLNFFDPAQPFGSIMTKVRTESGGLYLSFNRYFYSTLPKYRPFSSIWSIGLGYAKANNYNALKKRTFEDGKLTFNTDSTLYQSVVETSSGALGSLEEYNGLSAFGELFIPIIRNQKYGSIHLGGRLTYYGISKEDKLINGSTGFYIAIKDKDKKDAANFSITGRFNKLNENAEDDYLKNNFSLVLQGAIPLSFN